MKICDLAQGSDGWHRWRNAGIGGSDAPAVLGLSPWTSVEQLWRAKVSHYHGLEKTPAKPDNPAMRRGRALEPVARTLYEEWMGWQAFPLCVMHDEHDFLKASLDGWAPLDPEAERVAEAEDWGLVQRFADQLGRTAIGVEIKAPNRNDHQGALEGVVPEKYKPQCDHLLLVSGARLLHYVSYSDYFAGANQFACVTVQRDEEALAELLKVEQEFWACVVERRKPDWD
jgi:putative phage-type endonuclease